LCKHCNLGKSNKDDTDFRIKSWENAGFVLRVM
jgi:hypothetical protein